LLLQGLLHLVAVVFFRLLLLMFGHFLTCRPSRV
jgi:hypothetical protein